MRKRLPSLISMQKRVFILAGANGSGKSTISKVFLPAEGVVYINPDDTAKMLNPNSPEHAKIEAGKTTLRSINELMTRGESFAIESTLAGVAYAKMLQRAKGLGYQSSIVYVFVDSPDVCIARIAARVKNGGHFIPAEDVRRRFWRSKRNFLQIYADIVDYWTLLYNGDSQVSLVARKDNGFGTTVLSDALYNLFKEGL